MSELSLAVLLCLLDLLRTLDHHQLARVRPVLQDHCLEHFSLQFLLFLLGLCLLALGSDRQLPYDHLDLVNRHPDLLFVAQPGAEDVQH